MKNFLLILFFACASVLSNAHELHFSIANIDVYPDSLCIAIRITTNDLLLSINSDNSKQNCQIHTEIELTESQIVESKNYFSSNLIILVNSEKLKLQFNSVKFDGINYWFYFKNTQINNIESFTLSNTIFIETFNNQKNLVTIKCGDIEKGFDFTVDDIEKIITLK